MATLHKTDDAKQMMRSDPDGQMQQSKTIFCIKPRLATYPQCKQVPKKHRNNEKSAIIMLLSGLVIRQMESAQVQVATLSQMGWSCLVPPMSLGDGLDATLSWLPSSHTT